MDARELRIGNYIKDSKNRILKVDGIKIDETVGFEIDAWPIKGGGIVSLPYLKIPLTEQWLLDFGFEKSQDEENVYNILCFSIDTEVFMLNLFHEGEGFSYRIGLSSTEYVHQLQNLFFALTGEELTIK